MCLALDETFLPHLVPDDESCGNALNSLTMMCLGLAMRGSDSLQVPALKSPAF